MRVPTPAAESEQERSGLFMFVARRESQSGITYFGRNISEAHVDVQESPQGSPDPIRQSAFSDTGRAPTERWASVPVAIHMNIAGRQSVMEDSFLVGKVYPQRLTLMRNELGGQLPFTERQNIDRGDSEPYGNRLSVQSMNQYPVGHYVDSHGLTYAARRRV